MGITRQPIPKSDWLHSLQSDGEALYSQQKQDQELTVAQTMNSLLPNSDLNWRRQGKPLDHSGIWPKSNPLWLYSGSDKQIQGIRADRVPEELLDGGSWHCTGGSDQHHPQEKEMQKGKMVVWGVLTNIWGKKIYERKRRKERYTHLNAEFQRIARRDEKAFLSD